MKEPANNLESSAIEAAAADWFVRRRDGLQPEAEARYQAWVGADPRHAAAMAELQATWDEVSFPATVMDSRDVTRMLDRMADARRRHRLRIALAGLGAAAMLAIAFFAFGPSRKSAPPAAAVAVRPDLKQLPDGSTVELNAGAGVAIEFTPEHRSVRLLRGEAFFSVAENPARPFVVSADGVEVRAVGTAFSVRSDAAGVGVLVTNGRVAVEPVGPGAPPRAEAGDGWSVKQPIYLDAGGQLAFSSERTQAPPPAVKHLSAEEAQAALAWRRKRVEFTRMPLSEVAALFNVQNRLKLSVSDGPTATIPISGIYWSDDPEGLVRLLGSGLGVRAKRVADTIFLSSR